RHSHAGGPYGARAVAGNERRTLPKVLGNQTRPGHRRAAEAAIAVARACGCPLTALYVAGTGRSDGAPRRHRGFRARQQELAIIKDIVATADRYDLKIRTAVHSDVAPDEAILAEAKEGGHDLIVMGVGRRPGDNAHPTSRSRLRTRRADRFSIQPSH